MLNTTNTTADVLGGFRWPPKPIDFLPGNTRKGPMKVILINFPTYSLRVSMLLLILLATMVIYHVLIHVAKLILEVRKMALELSQPSRVAKNMESAHPKEGGDHHGPVESTMQLAVNPVPPMPQA